ncbi:YsnF/AvaK domain-containing protein [Massilia oculi]|uniref:DUF2382 domain-containing protein n=1 Tax=Massilia oculi TaxID=945844 RepID=A0A2S2DCZ4_9BURK|nr:YsnF/AvaK domain-containing protein [Massilia oculi]AWL03208.1 hypothetical protein DIR46_01215 [Massilia oculi]
MHHTLVAVFDNRTDAQRAYDQLLSSGFSRSSVRLSDASPASGGATTAEGIGTGIKHFFQDLFGDEHKHHASRYEGALARGQHVVTLSADSLPEVERAADVVEAFGPVDVEEHSEGVATPGALHKDAASRQGAMRGGAPSSQSAAGHLQGGASGASLQRATATGATIPVVEEQLRVGKREVQRGGMRIFSRIVETPVHETIGLREEHVDVQRRKVDQPISPSDVAAFREQTIEMRESAEEAVVEKSARITEEVSIGKEVSERQQQIDDTVRHTEVDVERLGVAMGDQESYYREHFRLTYGASGGAYDDYAPAYLYGSQVAGSGKYAGRQWDEIEPELRTDWESRHRGVSTWEKMKAAVRHGWDRMTGHHGA